MQTNEKNYSFGDERTVEDEKNDLPERHKMTFSTIFQPFSTTNGGKIKGVGMAPTP